ncbi:MAG: hypothetical protein IH994_07125, partial [Proteobacteria bacterium]|nr:hypothetical protein [Pseudomonadota bacterium]
MREKAEEIGKAGIDYRTVPNIGDPDQTSNSVVRAALDVAGVPLEKALPDGVTPDKLPGIRDNLAEKIEETRRERERPNPIEGEIGGTGDQKPTPPPTDPSDPSGDDTSDDDTSDKDSSGDGQNQSARLPDPGDDTGNETKDFTPEQKKLMDDFGKSDGPLDDI